MDFEDKNILLFKCRIYEEIIKKHLNIDLDSLINNNLHLLSNIGPKQVEKKVEENSQEKVESKQVEKVEIKQEKKVEQINSENVSENKSEDEIVDNEIGNEISNEIDDEVCDNNLKYEIQQKQKGRYKKLIHVIEVKEEKYVINKNDVNEKYKEMFDTVHFDYNIYQKEFDSIIENIKTNRVYTKFIENIRSKRVYMPSKLSNNEIIIRLKYEIKLLEKVLDEKNVNKKKIREVILNKFLYPNELRRILYENSEQLNIEIDELKNLEACFKIKNCFCETLKEFKIGNLTKNLETYEICFFSLDEFLKMNLINKYGYNNYIYISLPKSKEEDPFGFYYLESTHEIGVGDYKKYWKMDCRCEELAYETRDKLLTYTIKLYRDLYYLINHDNVYRENIVKYSQIYEYEFDQILSNLAYLCDHYTFCKMLQGVIIKNSDYTNFITENDLFNLYGDDLCQKKTFQKLNENNENYNMNLRKITQNLYDDISEEEITNFINLKMNNLK